MQDDIDDFSPRVWRYRFSLWHNVVVCSGENSCCSSFYILFVWVDDFHTIFDHVCRNHSKSQPWHACSATFNYSTHCPCNVVRANSRYVRLWRVVLERVMLELEAPVLQFVSKHRVAPTRRMCCIFVILPYFLHFCRRLLMSAYDLLIRNDTCSSTCASAAIGPYASCSCCPWQENLGWWRCLRETPMNPGRENP